MDGFLYGAGVEKIGSIVGKGAKEGQQLRDKFLRGFPALSKLLSAVQKKVESTNTLRGLDGRILNVRSPHSALNMLLQSAGALIMKRATVEFIDLTKVHGYVWGKDFALVAHIHDEMQVEARPEIAEHIGQLMVEGMQKAGAYFEFRCPIDGEYKVGKNWAETH